MNDLASLLEPLRRAVRDDPHRLRLRELPAGPALDGPRLLEAVASQAAALARLGVGKDDLVLLALPNSAAFAVAALGCWQAGAGVILAPGPGAAEEHQRLAGRFGAATVIGPEGGALPARPARGRSGGPPGAAVVKLTSGSTGEARGVVITRAQIAAGGRQILDTMGIGPCDTNIGFIPMSHSYGFDNLILPLVLQGSPLSILADSTPSALFEALCLTEPCVFPGVPYLFDLLSRAPQGWRPSGLRLCVSAGAPLHAGVAGSFRQRCGLEVHNFYGTTETGGICFERRPSAADPDGSVGQPLTGVRVELEPMEGSEAEGGGRVVVHSAAVASGYWPEEGGAAGGGPAGGRFATGDLGRLLPDGRLQLLGRIDDLINVGGRKIHPAEVEEALRALPGVREAAAFPLEDPRRGEALAACVAGDGGLRSEALLEALGARLPRHKVPRHLAVVPSLPRTERGKPDRKKLRTLFGASADAAEHKP